MRVVLWGLCAVLVFCAGCETKIEGEIDRDGRTGLRVSAALGPRISALIRGLSARSAGAPQALLPAAELERAFRAIDGIETAVWTQKTPSAVDGRLVIRKIGELLPPETRGVIRWEQRDAGGKALIKIDREKGPAFIALLSQELSDYLSTLMAPIVTGEELTQEEYLELVSSVYGAEIAQEISAARVAIRLSFPQPLSSVRGGSAAGNQARFDTPLVAFLVLEKPLVFEIEWGRP
jgi:hypothetical protein